MGTTPKSKTTPRRAMTSKEVKANFKKNGHQMSSQQKRCLARGAELERRAQKIKDAEERKKVWTRKMKEKEQRSREERRRLNIASQKPYVSPHQMLLNGFVKSVTRPESVEASRDQEDNVELWDDEELDRSILEEADGSDDEAQNANVDQIKSQHDVKATHSSDETGNQSRAEPQEEEQTVTQEQADWIVHRTAQSSVPADCVRASQSETEERQQTASTEVCDAWEGFLDSSTQIARDLDAFAQPKIPARKPAMTKHNSEFDDFFMSTQDVSFSSHDLEELGLGHEASSNPSKPSIPSSEALDPKTGVAAENGVASTEKALLDRKQMPPPMIAPRRLGGPKHHKEPTHSPVLGEKMQAVNMSQHTHGQVSSTKSSARPIFGRLMKTEKENTSWLLDDVSSTAFELSTQDCRDLAF